MFNEDRPRAGGPLRGDRQSSTPLRRFVSYRALPDFPLIVAVSDLTVDRARALPSGAPPSTASPRLIFTLFVVILAWCDPV